MGRPRGKPNAKPTRANIDGYYRMLKTAAAKGDTNAAGQLIQLDQHDRALPVDEIAAGKIGAVMAAYLPRDEWNKFPAAAQEFAETLTRKVRELAAKEDAAR